MNMVQALCGRRKPIAEPASSESGAGALKRTLGPWQLVALGVGAIVGTGIYTLTGIGAGLAGPSVILSFAIAGIVCACAALAYAELSTMIPASGSAYTYTYSVLGETLAWIVGCALILEYTVVCAAVAAGWSGYAAGVLNGWGIGLPAALSAGPHAGGIINLLAVAISFAVAGMLMIGTRESAAVNFVLVLVKLAALAAFIAIALPAFSPERFHPFMPYGFADTDALGHKKGVMAAAALIFFAFYGFDTISTAAEETKNPGRDLKIGIIGSMAICTLLYMLVAAAALGSSSFLDFSASPEPLAFVMRSLGAEQAATLIGAAATIAMPTVILVFMYGQSRIFFVMARDGLLPHGLSKVNPKTGTPILMTFVTGCVVAAISGFFPLREIAELANAGTLCAFTAVAVCMLVMRVREPERPRVFRAPLPWLTGPLAVIGCVYLFFSLPVKTMTFFLIWTGLGFVFYLLYARRKSLLNSSKI